MKGAHFAEALWDSVNLIQDSEKGPGSIIVHTCKENNIPPSCCANNSLESSTGDKAMQIDATICVLVIGILFVNTMTEAMHSMHICLPSTIDTVACLMRKLHLQAYAKHTEGE